MGEGMYEDQFRAWAEAKGWQVTKRGWPDFLCRYDGAVVGVEVKGGNDGLSREQDACLRDLNAIGMPTYVWTPETGLTAHPTIAPTESLSTLRAYISDLEALVRQLMAVQNEQVTGALRFIPTVVERQKAERAERKARWREREAAMLLKHGPEWVARWKADMARHRPELPDPALTDLRRPY